MSYTNNDIIAKAIELAPSVSSQGEAMLSALCMAAEAELKGRLKSGALCDEIEELFVTAAGLLAVAMLTEISQEERISAFTAGSVSVELGGESVSAASLRRRAENMLRGYIESDDFAFMGVLG